MNPFAEVDPMAWVFGAQWWNEYAVEYGFRPLWLTAIVLLSIVLIHRTGVTESGQGSSLDDLFARIRPHFTLIIVVLALTSAACSRLVSYYYLGDIPHLYDTLAHVYQADVFRQGHLYAPPPPPELASALEHPFLTEVNGRRFSIYQPLFPAALAGAWRLGLREWLNPLLNALSIMLIYSLLSTIVSRGRAFVVAGLLTLSPFVVFMGASLLGHPISLLSTLVCLVGFDLWVRRSRTEGLALLSFGAGLLAAERPYTGLFVVIVPALMALRLCLTRPASLRQKSCWLASIAMPLLLCLGALGAYNHAVTGQALLTPRQASDTHAWNRPGFGSDRGFYLDTIIGHNLWRGLSNATVNLATLNQDLFGWPLLSLLLPIIGLSAPPSRWKRNHLVIASRISLPLVMVGYIAYFHPGVAFGARFYYETLPHLAILTAMGLERLIGHDLRRRYTLSWALFILLMTNLTTYVPVRLPYFQGYGGVAAGGAAYALSEEFKNTVVLVPRGDMSMGTHLYYSFSSFNDPFLRRFPLFLRAEPHLTAELLHQLFPGARIVKARFSGFSS